MYKCICSAFCSLVIGIVKLFDLALIDAAIVLGMVLLAETSSLIGDGPKRKGVYVSGK